MCSRVVITRSREGNAVLSDRIVRLGLTPVPVDTLSFSPPDDWSLADSLLSRFSSFDWVLFTSATGVRFFAQRAIHLGRGVTWSGKPHAAAIGPRTASALTALRIEVEFVPSSYCTRSLADELPLNEGLRILLLHSNIANRGLVKGLQERGFDVEHASIYSTTSTKRKIVELNDSHFVLFASPSAVRGLCSMLPLDELSKLKMVKAVCIGPATEMTAKELGFSDTVIPREYTLDAALKELARLSRNPT